MKFITNHQWILASASPRRKELLSMINIPFTTISSDVDEKSVGDLEPKHYVEQVALLKAKDIASKYPQNSVIGADTIVVYDQKLLHKPANKAEAIQHLKTLSNNRHQVMTAVAIITAEGEITTFVEETSVYFHDLSEELIGAYVNTGDPFDKAGGYGIQTQGALLVKKIEGDYNNVVGLPIAKLTALLLEKQYISL